MHRSVSSAIVEQSAPAGASEAYPEATAASGLRRTLGHPARTAVHVALAAVVAAAAVAYATVLRPSAPSRQPVLVEDLAVGDLDGRRLAVTVTVASEHRDRKIARVWWLLAVPGGGPEWDRRAYRSSVRSMELAPGEEASTSWDQEAEVPPGLYTVSAWVHVEGANGFNHEDGRIGADVEIGPDPGPVRGESLLRAGPPRFGVGIERVDGPHVLSGPPGSGSTMSGEASVVVRNPTDQTYRAILRWGVFPVVENVPMDWWRQPAAWWGPPQALDVPPGESRQVTLGDVGVAEPGRYGMRVLLDTAAREAGGALDDVAVPTPLDVREAPG